MENAIENYVGIKNILCILSQSKEGIALDDGWKMPLLVSSMFLCGCW